MLVQDLAVGGFHAQDDNGVEFTRTGQAQVPVQEGLTLLARSGQRLAFGAGRRQRVLRVERRRVRRNANHRAHVGDGGVHVGEVYRANVRAACRNRWPVDDARS